MANHKLAALSRDAAAKGKLWIPEYHSISNIDGFNSHYDALSKRAERDGVDVELGQAEEDWIFNEYSICACDYRYWSEKYAKINDGGDIIRFQRRASQSMLVDMWGDRQEKGYAIEQQVLKARQQGISTEVELAITHLVNFGVGVKAAIASYDSDACERMGGMMDLAFNEIPQWMRATPTSNRAGSLYAFSAINTRLTFYSGRKASGIARGDTPNVIHISEVASFPDAENIIENSLFQSVHPKANTFMILESTGEGNTNWWAKTWYSSRDFWETGGARLQPVFFPWFIASDLFPTPDWRREHPVPRQWSPITETRKMMEKAASYVHQTPTIRKFLGDKWRMPDWQAYFWEVKFLEYRRKGNEKGWLQEMPMDDIEALQPKKDLVFDLTEVQTQEKHRPQYTAWAIVGQQIQEKWWPNDHEIDFDTPRFSVTYDGHIHDLRGRENRTFEWEFVPLKQPVEKGIDIFDANEKCLISDWPREGWEYSIGVDNGEGVGKDNTVITVCGKSMFTNEPDRQVCEFVSNRIDPAFTHPYVMAIASLYKACMPEGKEPLVAIEQVYGLGETTQIQMKSMGYKRFYNFTRLDGKNPEADKKKSKRTGWFTTEWSRPFMLTLFRNAVHNHWFKLFSPHLLKNEMPSYQIDQTATGKVRFDHESNKHDDRIVASAISFVVLNDTESMTRRLESVYSDEEEQVEIDYSYPTVSQRIAEMEEALES